MRKVIKRVSSAIKSRLMPIHTEEETNLYVYNQLMTGKPLMIAKFGAVEIKALLYALLPWPINLTFRRYTYNHFGNNAGFFPVKDTYIREYKDLILKDITLMDMMCSWRPEELLLRGRLKHVFKFSFINFPLTPWPEQDHWIRAFKNKKVLIVSPFADTIQYQYDRLVKPSWGGGVEFDSP